jgi:hypothetical protein
MTDHRTNVRTGYGRVEVRLTLGCSNGLLAPAGLAAPSRRPVGQRGRCHAETR